MEPSGSTYLYALAAVSIAFVGFSALLVIFRQARGETMTKYESYFLLSFIQPGFIVTGGSLLPSVLALYGLPVPTVWRVASSVMAIPILLFVATLPGRRHAATAAPIPRYVLALSLGQLLIALYLVANAVGPAATVGVGPYAAAMTALLFTTAIATSLPWASRLENDRNDRLLCAAGRLANPVFEAFDTRVLNRRFRHFESLHQRRDKFSGPAKCLMRLNRQDHRGAYESTLIHVVRVQGRRSLRA